MKKRLAAALALLTLALAPLRLGHAAPPPAIPPQGGTGTAGAAGVAGGTETIVLIRHGEKTPTEMGQLDEQGLNRALALPDVLVGKYGRPDYLFAPNPSVQVTAPGGASYSYVRPLATIEPTAIRLGLPVNTQIGLGDIQGLQAELTKPQYARSLIFVAWEHTAEDEFARNVMKAYGGDASVVPHWPGKDFDSIFVIRLVRPTTAAGAGRTGGATATFTVDHEGLDGKLSANPPGPAGP